MRVLLCDFTVFLFITSVLVYNFLSFVCHVTFIWLSSPNNCFVFYLQKESVLRPISEFLDLGLLTTDDLGVGWWLVGGGRECIFCGREGAFRTSRGRGTCNDLLKACLR